MGQWDGKLFHPERRGAGNSISYHRVCSCFSDVLMVLMGIKLLIPLIPINLTVFPEKIHKLSQMFLGKL